MVIRRPRSLPQHHIITSSAAGGQSGKSSLAMMLAAYLSVSPQAHTVLVLDIVSPRIGIYECFQKLFNVERTFSAENSPVLKAPRIDDKSTRNLLVVRVAKQDVRTWQGQVKSIQKIQDNLINRGYNITHVITETNLQPDDQGTPVLFTELDYSSLAFWTVWLKSSIAYKNLYEDLAEMQDDYDERPLQWYFVHNPYQDVIERDGEGDYAAMKLCYDMHPPLSFAKNNAFISLADHASNADNGGLTGDEYWNLVYSDYLNKNTRPANLLPVFRRSERFLDVMQQRFASLSAIHDPKELADLLDNNSNKIYSRIFSPFFASVGV
jgi:hypothetical protein